MIPVDTSYENDKSVKRPHAAAQARELRTLFFDAPPRVVVDAQAVAARVEFESNI
jgi:hypothetical protein